MIALAKYNENPYELNYDKLTFSDVYDEWSKKHFENLSEASIKAYRIAYNRCKALHPIKIKKITLYGLQKVLDGIESPSSRQQTKIFLNQLYKYAYKHEIVNKNYAELTDNARIEPKQDKIPFTQEEIKTLWKNTHLDGSEIVLMLIYTGFRITELLELKKENIHLEERYIIGGKKTPAGKGRVVPIHKKVLPFFEKCMKQPYLFMNTRNQKLKYNNFLKDQFKPLMKELNMKHTPHDTRHTFTSLLHDLNISDLVIKKLVGHATKDVTDRYTHKNIQTLIEAVDRLE